MAKKEKKKKKEKSKKAKTSWIFKLSVVFFVIFSIMVLQQTTIMLVIAMLPAIVAYIVDNTSSRSWFKTLFCCNLAGALPYLGEVYFSKGNSFQAMQQQMADFSMWLIIYASAGFAWVLIWGLPQISEAFYRSYYYLKSEEHKKKLRRLKQEWKSIRYS